MDGRVYTVARLAEHWSCSETFVRDEIRRGRLVAYRFGSKLIRITPEAVAAYEQAANVVAAGEQNRRGGRS